MSREAYQIPTSQTNSAPGAGAAGSRPFDGEGASMNYICGDCGYKFALRRSDTIRCKECGCRILYKERTKRMVQFEAR
ncbi:DNA directed RNA polymerase [Xylaria intraflava]|nr:DNA directed RNA polymerase [Xylaria intraflava]